MSRNLKSDIESNNEAILHTESNKLESKKDSKNKDEVRLDSNGDEIMYEAKHNLTWWDYIMYSLFFLIGIGTTYSGIESFLSNEIAEATIMSILGIPFILFSLYPVFYARKNRFYITTQGIGFERRKWFRMQKGFFKFGEVGATRIICFTGSCPIIPPNVITIFPLGNIKRKQYIPWLLKPYCIFYLVIWNIYISPKIYNSVLDEHYLHNFLIKKTKEALESKGIDTNSLCYDLEKQFDIY